MAHRGVLRHCLMAGLCSAAERTQELTASHDAEIDERSRLGGAKYRCPYGTPANDADVDRSLTSSGASETEDTVELHCERKWIEDNNV